MVVGHQRWRDLLFLHWSVSADALRRIIPPALDVDLREETAYVGIVAFASTGLRLAGFPARLGLDFLETNVRTYVRCRGTEPCRGAEQAPSRGVYFLSLDAGSRSAALGGRRLVGLPYFLATIDCERRGREIAYELRRRQDPEASLSVRYETEGRPAASCPGTLEDFLIERYRFHVLRGWRMMTMCVRHAPYRVQPVRIHDLDESLISAAGLPEPVGDPIAHYSPGVDADFLAPGFER